MPTFKSLESLMKYVKNASANSIRECGEEMKTIMQDEVQTQVYDAYRDNEWRTGQLKNSIDITHISDNNVIVSWQDNGGWYSLINGNHMYAIYGLEMGKTWGEDGYRPQTNLVEASRNRIDNEIPLVYKRAMKSKGVPIK